MPWLRRSSTAARGCDSKRPQRLPTAVVEGSTATYPEVFPGVDLVAKAGFESVETFLVVKSRQASPRSAGAVMVDADDHLGGPDCEPSVEREDSIGSRAWLQPIQSLAAGSAERGTSIASVTSGSWVRLGRRGIRSSGMCSCHRGAASNWVGSRVMVDIKTCTSLRDESLLLLAQAEVFATPRR